MSVICVSAETIAVHQKKTSLAGKRVCNMKRKPAAPKWDPGVKRTDGMGGAGDALVKICGDFRWERLRKRKKASKT